MRLQGKVAIVTGAGSGNGRGIALRFAEEGARVIVADVAEAGAAETVAQIAAVGGTAAAVRADVSDKAQAQIMAEEAVRRFGALDILVNNAGIEFLTPFLDISESEWDRILDVNLKGAFLCGQAAARRMVTAGRGGKILNIASINSQIALAKQAHYVSSKGGLLMLTKAMAIELAPHRINVNAIGPGVIDTALTKGSLADPERRAMLLSHVPWGRVGQPRDIANAALFLCTDEADYVTGTILYVDGGWLIS
jgi:glucose 1-dehydrogenase